MYPPWRRYKFKKFYRIGIACSSFCSPERPAPSGAGVQQGEGRRAALAEANDSFLSAAYGFFSYHSGHYTFHLNIASK